MSATAFQRNRRLQAAKAAEVKEEVKADPAPDLEEVKPTAKKKKVSKKKAK